MNHQPRLNRRRACQTIGVALGGYFVAPLVAAEPKFDFDKFTGDQHACLELPYFNPDDPDEEKARSPTEVAYMIQEDRLANAPAKATQMATKEYPPKLQSAPARAAFANKKTIVDKTLRFFFMPFRGRAPDQRLVDRVIHHAREWTKHIDVMFDVVGDASRADYRVMCSRLLGHASHIGEDCRRVPIGQETMTLGFTDLVDFEGQAQYNAFVVMHEVGHALGLIHEHNRQDAALPFDINKTVAYFGQRGLTPPQVQYNIFDRWLKPLVKFSQYDPLSIMHYMFPKEIMKSGPGTAQNFVLSPLDIQMAQEMYGAKEGPPPPPQPGVDTVATPLTIAIDGPPVAVQLAPNQVVALRLKVSAEQANLPSTIWTQGSTQVVLQLFGPNSDATEITPARAPAHGTYDLTNDVIQLTLGEGEYLIKAQHVSARGGGRLVCLAKSGEQFGARLLPANALLR